MTGPVYLLLIAWCPIRESQCRVCYTDDMIYASLFTQSRGIAELSLRAITVASCRSLELLEMWMSLLVIGMLRDSKWGT